jgi:hypothetical protein
MESLLLHVVFTLNILSALYNVALVIKHKRAFRKVFTETEQTLANAKALFDQVKAANIALQRQGATLVSGEGSGRWN